MDSEVNHSSSALTAGIQQRHLEAINNFQSEVRAMSTHMDGEAFSVLADLRTKLTSSRALAEDLVAQESDRVNSHRDFLTGRKQQFEEREPGIEVQPFTDCIHQDGPVDSITTRRARIATRCKEVLELGLKLRHAHDHRMGLIDSVDDFLKNGEAKRKAQIQTKIETLLSQLTTIAFTDVTGSQLLVQRAAISVNEQLLQNQMVTSRLISQLRQHELLKQRDYSKRMSEVYSQAQKVVCSSLVLWTQEYLASPLFRAPVSRTQLMLRIGKIFASTRRELSHAVEGIARLTESLEKKRDIDIVEQPGGTISDGLLRTYSDTDPEEPFPESPVIVAEETKVAIEVILHHSQCNNSLFLSECEKMHSDLLAKVDFTVATLVADLESTYTPKEDEIELVKRMSLNSEDVYPLHTIIRDEAKFNEAQEQANETFAPVRLQIAAECQWYIEGLGWNLCQQSIRLMATFITGSGSLIGTLWDATIRLESIATQVSLLVRQFYNKQVALQSQYEDRLRALEESYDATEYQLMHAGTVDGATLLCDEAMKTLEAIEALHCENHIRRTDLMSPTQEVLEDTNKKLGTDLQESLGVVLLSDVEAINDEIEKEHVAREKARLAAGNKKDLLKDFAALPPLRSKMDIDETKCITMSDGTEYMVVKDHMDVGFKPDSEKVLAEKLAAEQAAAATAANTKDSKAAKPVKDDKKDKKGANALIEETPTTVERPTTPSARGFEIFQQRNQAVFSDAFHPDALLDKSQLQASFQRLRAALLSWAATLSVNSVTSVSTYCKLTKEHLDERSNHLIRHHQRRAPTLQSQIYDIRVRELEGNSKGRVKYLTWLQQRLAQAKGNAAAAIEAGSRSVQDDIQTLQTNRKGLVAVASVFALDTHQRAFLERKRKGLVGSSKTAEQILKQLDHALGNIRHDVSKYQAERLKGFDEGGALSADELTKMQKQLADILADSQEVDETVRKEIAESVVQHEKEFEAELSAYEEQHALNVEELHFFTHMQEQFAAAKAKITTQIATSKIAEASLDGVLSELEHLVVSNKFGSVAGSAASGGKKGELDATHFLGIDYEAAGLMTDNRFTVDPSSGWQGDDEVLSHQFRACRLQSENLCRSSRALKLLTVLDELRKQLYLRGLSLGCLQFGVEYQLIPTDGYLESKRVDPTAALSAGATAAGAAGAKGDAKDSKKPPPKASKDKKDTSKGGADNVDAKNDDLGFLKVTRLELQAQRWLNPQREQLQTTATNYFAKHPPPLMREQVLGADPAAVTATLQRRVAEQEARNQAHVVAAVAVYREQVQRAHLAIHRFASELFVGLTNLSAETIDLRLADLFAIFNYYETSILTAKRKNNSVVKASMAAPSNRHSLDKLAQSEGERQKRNLEILKKYVGVVAREVQLETCNHATRAAHVLSVFFTIARGFVTPEHLVPGEEVIVGRHKGIKRLMRQRMKEEMAKGLEGTTVEKDAGGKKGDKKVDPKKAAPKKEEKSKGKGKGAAPDAKDEEEPPLPPLEKPLQEIPGITVNTIKLFEEFKLKNQGFTVKNHHLTPAQWLEEGKAPLEAALEPAAGAKKGAAAPKAPAKPAPKANPQGQQGQLQETASPELSAPIVTAAITAPKEKVYQQAILARQNSIEGFNNTCTAFADKMENKFAILEEIETSWISSWNEAVAVLRQASQSNAQATAPPAPATPPMETGKK